MRKEEIQNALIDFGLSENEALVYLAALSLGPSSVQDIAKEARLKRTTLYPIIESLKNRGLVNTHVHGLRKVFAAEEPERLESIIERRKERLKTILPELNAIHSLKSGESFIKFYEGTEGVKGVYDTILDDLKPGDPYLIMSDMEKFLSIDEEYFKHFIEKRARMNFKV